MLQDFLVNLAAQLTFVALAVIAGWMYVWVTHRRALQRFFGVVDTRRIIVYWSNVYVLSGGAVGQGNVPRAYSGSAVPFTEVIFLPLFQRLFNYVVPGLQGQPGILRRLLLIDVTVDAQVAPRAIDLIDATSSFVSFGSPGYNHVSLWVEQELHSIGRFVNDNIGIQIPSTPALTDSLTGFVQRTLLPGRARAAFYVAGISSQATLAAAYFLVSHWQYLRKRFGDQENFCVVLRADPTDYQRTTILMERGEITQH